MRFAFISDIHANLQAWNAVLKDIQGQKIKHIINLGDVVGYGPNPKEVLESVREHSEVSVIGNHDAVCVDKMESGAFNDAARTAIEWTRKQLDANDCAFFQDMAEKARPQEAQFLATHAEVVAPLNFSYILTEEDAKRNFAACEDKLIFIGHTHRQGVFTLEESGDVTIGSPNSLVCDPTKRYIINPGSVGDPRSEDIVASYCIYDQGTQKIEFRRVRFDIEAYRSAITASGLTTMPFFIRHLDAISSESTPPIPLSIEETDPQLNIQITPERALAKKKKNHVPIIIAGLLFFMLGLAFWILTNQKNSTQSPPSKQAKTTEKAPTLAEATPVISKPQPLPEISGTDQFPIARYVRIIAPHGKPLVLAEVEVISDKVNIALVKKVTQSSTRYKTSHASRAIDGIREGKKPSSLAHTRADTPAWWEVDLGENHRIDAINIWNRQASPAVKRRLNNCFLILRNHEGETVYQMPQKVDSKSRVINVWLKAPSLKPEP